MNNAVTYCRSSKLSSDISYAYKPSSHAANTILPCGVIAICRTTPDVPDSSVKFLLQTQWNNKIKGKLHCESDELEY